MKVSTTRNRCAIIASCCEVDFDAAAAAIDEHNASRPADHGKAWLGHASPMDMLQRAALLTTIVFSLAARLNEPGLQRRMNMANSFTPGPLRLGYTEYPPCCGD